MDSSSHVDVVWMVLLLTITGLILGWIIRQGWHHRSFWNAIPLRQTPLQPLDIVIAWCILCLGALFAQPILNHWNLLAPPTSVPTTSPASAPAPSTQTTDERQIAPVSQPATESAEDLFTSSQQAARALIHQSCTLFPIVIYILFRLRQSPNGLFAFGLLPHQRWYREISIGLFALLLAIPCLWTVNVAVSLLSHWIGQAPPVVGHELLKAFTQSPPALAMAGFLVSSLVLAPFFEEILFRGLLQSACLPIAFFQQNRPILITLNAVLFAAVHAGSVTWQAYPPLFLLGLTLGWLYERYQSLWPCIICHALFNGLNILMTLYLLDV